MALRRALLAVKPAASRDDVRERECCQIEVDDGQATAVRRQLFAQYSHPALAGLQFRIARRDVEAIATLLTLTEPTVIVRADENGVTIEDQQQRFGFRPPCEPMPSTDRIAAAKPTYAVECDQDELLNALVLAGLVTANSGKRVLQIGFSLAVQDLQVHLRADTEWRPNLCRCSSIPIHMTPDQEKTLRREIAPSVEADDLGGSDEASAATATNASLPSNVPVRGESTGPSLVEDISLLELGHCLHADLLAIVKSMTAPILSCGFIKERVLIITGKSAETEAVFAFLMEAQDRAHGLTPRRR